MREQNPQPEITAHDLVGEAFDAPQRELARDWDAAIESGGGRHRKPDYDVEADDAKARAAQADHAERVRAHVAQGLPIEELPDRVTGRHHKPIIREDLGLAAQYTGSDRSGRHRRGEEPADDGKPTRIVIPSGTSPRGDSIYDVAVGNDDSRSGQFTVRLDGSLPISPRAAEAAAATTAEAPNDVDPKDKREASTDERQRIVVTPTASTNPTDLPGLQRVTRRPRHIKDTKLDTPAEAPAEAGSTEEEQPLNARSEEPAFPIGGQPNAAVQPNEDRPTARRATAQDGSDTGPRVLVPQPTTDPGTVVIPGAHVPGSAPVVEADDGGHGTSELPSRRSLASQRRYVSRRFPVSPTEDIVPPPETTLEEEAEQPFNPYVPAPESYDDNFVDAAIDSLGLKVTAEGDVYHVGPGSNGSEEEFLGNKNKEGMDKILELAVVKSQGKDRDSRTRAVNEIDNFDEYLVATAANAGATLTGNIVELGGWRREIADGSNAERLDQLHRLIRTIREDYKKRGSVVPLESAGLPPATPEPAEEGKDEWWLNVPRMDGTDPRGPSIVVPPMPTTPPNHTSPAPSPGRHRGPGRIRRALHEHKGKVVTSTVALIGAASLGGLLAWSTSGDSNESPNEYRAPAATASQTPGQSTEVAPTQTPKETRSATAPTTPSATTVPAAPTETTHPVAPPKPTTPPAVPGTATTPASPAQPAEKPKVEAPQPVENRLDKVSFIPKEAGSIAVKVEVKQNGTTSDAIFDALKAAEAAKLKTPQSNLATTYSIVDDLRNRGVDVDNIVEGQTYEIVLDNQGNVTGVTS